MTFTPEEIQNEWDYRFNERLGILCGLKKPTTEQLEIAMKEAEEWKAWAQSIGQSSLPL